MSNNFINSDINDLLSSIQSDKLPLPQWLNIIDKNQVNADPDATSENNMTAINNINYGNDETSENVFTANQALSATSDNIPVQNGGFNSATSSDINDIFIGQLGGDDKKESGVSPTDINNLIDMLTSEKVNNNFDNAENTEPNPMKPVHNISFDKVVHIYVEILR